MKPVPLYLDTISKNVKQPIVALFLVVFYLIVFYAGGCSGQTTTDDKKDAFQVLAEEQAQAETCVFLLNEFGKNDPNKYAKGIRLYAEARAAFNGLIALMKKKLTSAEPIDKAPEFDRSLETAVDRRISFTTFIYDEVSPEKQGQKGLGKFAIGNAGELISALNDVGKTIWQEYRSVQDARRQELLDQLDAYKWKAFHQIGGG